MRRAPATRIGAKRGPGARPSRSIGPEIEIAATTSPAGERTGADTDATPASRWATDCAQPAPAHLGQGSRGELRVGEHLVERVPFSHGELRRTAPAPRTRP